MGRGDTGRGCRSCSEDGKTMQLETSTGMRDCIG